MKRLKLHENEAASSAKKNTTVFLEIIHASFEYVPFQRIPANPSKFLDI